MQNVLELKNLSRKEKIRIMEDIWEDLLKEDEEIISPAWHREALQETERRLGLGQENIIDWKDAKNDLRKKFE